MTVPHLWRSFELYREQRSDLVKLVSRWDEGGVKGRRLISLVRVFRMTRLLHRMLDESEFLSPYGVRARPAYLDQPYDFEYDGLHYRVKYEPGESAARCSAGTRIGAGPFGCRSIICSSRICVASISSTAMGSRSSVRPDPGRC